MTGMRDIGGSDNARVGLLAVAGEAEQWSRQHPTGGGEECILAFEQAVRPACNKALVDLEALGRPETARMLREKCDAVVSTVRAPPPRVSELRRAGLSERELQTKLMVHYLQVFRAASTLSRFARGLAGERTGKDSVATSAATGRAKLTKEETALGLIANDPSLTVTEIARRAGCSRTSLYRMEKFKAALDAVRAAGEEAKRRFPKGHKGADGDLEAYDY